MLEPDHFFQALAHSPLPPDRPLVVQTWAQTLDGSVAWPDGAPLTISSPPSLRFTHRLRASCDSILVGIGAVLADDPRLTARYGAQRQPQPLVLDTHLRLPPHARILQHARPPWILTGPQPHPQRAQTLRERGAHILPLPLNADHRIDLAAALRLLRQRGIHTLMVEGVIFGQGVVGLLTMGLLAQTPLAQRLALDRYPLRRELSLAWGADACLDPDDPQVHSQLESYLRRYDPQGRADLSFELSGAPAALQQALDITGFAGRVIIGSWYGNKPVTLNLGGAFHRDRIHLISSQVSTLAPALTGRWTKARRLQVAWDWIQRLHPADLVTDTLPLEQAPQAYHLLDTQPQAHLQILLRYPALKTGNADERRLALIHADKNR